MLKSIKRLVILATVLAVALIPSVASARPVGPDHPYVVTAVQTAPAHPVATTSISGFSWHDAALGAAAMLILVGIGTGATLAVRRRGAILS